MKTIIYRHRKENKKKCTLSPLEDREDLLFLCYPQGSCPDLSSYIILKMDAPVLTIKDKKRPLFLIDSTWRYSDKMLKSLPNSENLTYRSLPDKYITAYPRKQTACLDPKRGLASVEALYLAYYILGHDTKNLLDHYYWKNEFLQLNHLPY